MWCNLALNIAEKGGTGYHWMGEESILPFYPTRIEYGQLCSLCHMCTLEGGSPRIIPIQLPGEENVTETS
jgi:hypothetical protein